MRSFQPFVPVDSHTKERAERIPVVAPEVGLRWGRSAAFSFDEPVTEEQDRRRTGMTIRWPTEHRHRVVVYNLTPVWRKYDVLRIRNVDNPATEYVDVRVTREALLPIGSETMKFLGPGVGYVEDTDGLRYEERVIHSFVLLKVPSPLPDGEKVGEGEEGEWPKLPEEVAPPQRYDGVMTWETHFSRGMEQDWTR